MTVDQAVARLRQLEQARPDEPEYWREVRRIVQDVHQSGYNDGYSEAQFMFDDGSY